MMRTITLNIGYGMLLDKLLKYIGSNSPTTDIFCFQEVDLATKDALDSMLTDKYETFYTTKFDKDEKFLLATYVNRKYEVLETEEMLGGIEDVGLALTCRLADKASGKRFAVTNIHGFPRPGSKLDTTKRIEQSRLLIDSAEKDICHIFLGDFNLLPEAKSITMFKENGFRDLIGEFHIPTTRNSIIWDRFPGNKQLFADYVFVKNGSNAICNLKTDEDIISDHLPLIFDLDLQSLRYFRANTRLVSNSGNTEVSQVLNAAN